MKSLSETDRAWLVVLWGRLWERHTSRARANMSGHLLENVYYLPKDKERITGEEWSRVQALIAEHELPVSLGNSGFCFGLAIYIYDHSTPPDAPAFLSGVAGSHLPLYEYPRDRDGFEPGWQAFSPIAKTSRNAELLAFYEMAAIREKNDYAY
jgi:hypothetical protein